MGKVRKGLRKRSAVKAGKRPARTARSPKAKASAKQATKAKSRNSLSITDNRTGRSYEIPVVTAVEGEAIRAQDLRQIRVNPNDFGLMSYDPAFTNTASCKSAITWIDGDAGILEYRGYPIEVLAQKSNYLEVAYLLIYGDLPTRPQYEEWQRSITLHTFTHENVKKFIDGFLYDAHPMGILVTAVAALSTFYPDAKRIFDESVRRLQIYRLIGKMPTLSAFAYRHSRGMPYVYPDNELSYSGNLLSMLFRIAEPRFSPDPILEKALDILFILHADHEQNCSANAMRAVGSSNPDPYSAIAAATSALYGPLHGGANEAVLSMLGEIGSKDKIPAYIKKVKAGKGRLMGFGHRVYKNFDPRANIIKQIADQVFEVTGHNPLLDIALELERIALEDDYFVERKLYPNVDFYSGIIYQAMGFPPSMFTVLFAIPRTAGWLAQWQEMLTDPETKIARPRQLYSGGRRRKFVALNKR